MRGTANEIDFTAPQCGVSAIDRENQLDLDRDPLRSKNPSSAAARVGKYEFEIRSGIASRIVSWEILAITHRTQLTWLPCLSGDEVVSRIEIPQRLESRYEGHVERESALRPSTTSRGVTATPERGHFNESPPSSLPCFRRERLIRIHENR